MLMVHAESSRVLDELIEPTEKELREMRRSGGGSGRPSEAPACPTFLSASTTRLTREPFDNVLVRQAIALALDRDQLCEAGYFGICDPVQGPVGQGSPWYFGYAPYGQDIERAKELLCAFWVKFNNHPAPPKTGVTAKESNTYVDFALINLGGLKADGSNGVNELTYLILEVIEEMRLLQPSSMVQVSKKSPDAFVKRAARIIRTGFGQPSVFNTDVTVQELLRQGKSMVDARNGGTSGCVEVGAFGKENYNLTAREMEIFRLAAKGMSNKQISVEMDLNLRTVKGHFVNIFSKHLSLLKENAFVFFSALCGDVRDPFRSGGRHHWTPYHGP